MTSLGVKKVDRQGHLSTIKLRVVCSDCNSGWMSKLESNAKPILRKMLTGEIVSLAESQQHLLSRWIAMKAIIGEHAGNKIHVTPTMDRLLVRSQSKIPEYFAIYIGRQGTESNTSWVRISQTLALSPDGPSPKLEGLTRNTQSIAFLCGPLFIYVLAIRLDGVDAANFVNFEKLLQLWPIKHTTIDWPATPVLTPVEMGRIAYALEDMKYLPNVHDGGDLS